MNPRVRFLSRCSALCVMQAGAYFKHTLELTFKQQIFMIFIVDYFCKKEFLKKFKFADNPYKRIQAQLFCFTHFLIFLSLIFDF